MNAQHKTKAQKRTLLLMLLLTCALAFAGGKLTAKAEAASTHTAVVAGPSRVSPPVEPTATTRRTHRTRTVIRGKTAHILRIASVNKSGVLAPGRTFVLVDESGHIVSPKGTRFGGRTKEAADASA